MRRHPRRARGAGAIYQCWRSTPYGPQSGGDGRAAFIIPNADQCMTPQNGLNPCHGTNFLQKETVSPSFVMSDQIYPALNGRTLFVGQPGSISLVDPVSFQVNLSYASGFQLLSAMTLDPTDLTLFVADDPAPASNAPRGRRRGRHFGAET